MEEELKSLPPWSLPIRIVVLVLLMLYLSVMVLAPLTNPVGAPELTTPVAKAVSPVHQALYLNHGYRFFAPDPGPSHSVAYEIEIADGKQIKGHFPDRDGTFPRLLYHRWFMLSESVYREFSLLSMKPEIDKILQQFDDQIADLARRGETEQSKVLAAERDEAKVRLNAAQVKFDGLMLKLARNLVGRFAAGEQPPKSIRMWIQRRIQPSTQQSRSGIKLTDQSLLTQAEVAFFTADQLAISEQVESQPELETIDAGGGDE